MTRFQRQEGFNIGDRVKLVAKNDILLRIGIGEYNKGRMFKIFRLNVEDRLEREWFYTQYRGKKEHWHCIIDTETNEYSLFLPESFIKKVEE